MQREKQNKNILTAAETQKITHKDKGKKENERHWFINVKYIRDINTGKKQSQNIIEEKTWKWSVNNEYNTIQIIQVSHL